MTADQSQPYVARDSRWRLVQLALGAAGFVVAGLWMAGLFGAPPSPGRWSPEKVMLVGWAGVLFFGLMLFVIVQRLRRAGEAFRIDAQGITHAQMVKQSFAWDEIVALQPVRMGNQPMICYEVVQARLDQLGGLRAKLAAANRSMTGCSFALAISGTDARFDDVLAALEAFAPEHLLPGD
ncbi:MAG: hypothetical protein KDE15_10610 [Erythrobacter sp.]|nr:hypothetical protein [Erythrobacter sp.]